MYYNENKLSDFDVIFYIQRQMKCLHHSINLSDKVKRGGLILVLLCLVLGDENYKFSTPFCGSRIDLYITKN